MSDERLRELERRWQATGSVEDEVAYLRHCLRAGVLRAERAALAAYLGHPAAFQAVARLPVPPVGEREASALERWGRALEPWGREALLRAALAAAGAPGEASPIVVRCLEELRRLVLEPDRPRYGAVDLDLELDELLEEARGAPNLGNVDWHLRLARELARLAAAPWTESGEPRAPADVDADSARCLGRCLTLLAERRPDDALRAAVRDALVPWALGRGDPLED